MRVGSLIAKLASIKVIRWTQEKDLKVWKFGMSRFKVNFEWIDPGGARGPELRATWARLQLCIDGEPVTRLLDQVSKTVRDGVFLPLYPLAEWLTTHWWFLLNEVEAPGRATEDGYTSRHNLHYAGEGFAAPPISFRPLGSTIKVDWNPAEFQHQRVEFVGRGTAYIDTKEFREEVSNFVSSVVSRLDNLGITDTLLQQEWRAILETQPDEREFCEVSAALGLDPYSISQQAEHLILTVGNRLPPALIDEFFAAAEFPLLQEQANSVLGALELGRANPADLVSLKHLRERAQERAVVAAPPWEQGYHAARSLRSELGLNGQILTTFEDLSAALGINSGGLNAALNTQFLRSDAFDAVIDVNHVGSPGFVLRHRREDTLKFAFCRGLFEFLTGEPREPLLITRTRSERQKRNRAFASEFLLPAETLRARVKTEFVGEEQIEDLGQEFGVSPSIVRHQLHNHRIAHTVPF